MTFTRQAASAVSIIVGASAFVACARAAAPASAAPAPMTLPVALVAPPDPRAELRAAIDSMIGAQEFRNMHWGVLVVDALDGDTLYSHNAGKLFMPASNQKILTGATALAQLGPDFRFRTTFAACGQVRRGTLQGDLVVHGRGDPSFSDAMRGDAMIPMREVADSLAAHGIRRIRGSIIAGADAFPDAPHGFGWAWDDFTEPYSAGVDELFFNEGFARIVLTPNPRRTRGAVIATSRPIRTYPRVEARQLTLLSASVDSVERRRARATTVPDTATRGYRLEGAVAVRDSTVLTVAYPEQRAAFLAALREGLAERGVKVEGASVRPRADAPAMAHCVGADTLYTLSSPPLREIMPVFEKPSQNQIGEILLKTLGLEKTGVGSADSGRRVVERQLAAWGATPDGAAVRDGSGLSRHDYVSPGTARPRARRDAARHGVPRLLRCASDRRCGWDNREPHAEHAGGGQPPGEDRHHRQSALAVRLRDRCRWPSTRLQHPEQQFHRARCGGDAGAGRDWRATRRPACATDAGGYAVTRRSPLVLTVPEAVERILADVHPLPPERVPLLDALGLVLASPAISPLTLPAWDNSAMDGYAVRAEDIRGANTGAPVTLPVHGTIAAGQFPSAPLAPATAIRIMTGAPIPDGADTVIRVEDTDAGTERVAIRDTRDSGKNIRPRGEDMREGAVVLEGGSAIGAAQIGVLASIGASAVDVHRRPRVAFLGSGDELVDLDQFSEALAGRKIVTSNSYTLHALVRAAGGIRSISASRATIRPTFARDWSAPEAAISSSPRRVSRSASSTTHATCWRRSAPR